jgi:hypothetical protein
MCGHLIDFTAIWYTYDVGIFLIIPILVNFIEKHLATLHSTESANRKQNKEHFPALDKMTNLRIY